MLTYKHQRFNSIRLSSKDDKIWFVGKDIAENIGYTRSRDAISKYVYPKDKQYAMVTSERTQGKRKMLVLNENGVRALIMSRMPEVRDFKAWIFDDVLPDAKKMLVPESRPAENTVPQANDLLKNKNASSLFDDMSEKTRNALLSECLCILDAQRNEMKHQSEQIEAANAKLDELSQIVKKQGQAIQELQSRLNRSNLSGDLASNSMIDEQKIRKTINSLVSRYSVDVKHRDWKSGWSDFKNTVRLDSSGPHIDIDSRLWNERKNGNKKATALSVLTREELPEVLKAVTRMCNEKNVYINDIVA